MFLPSLVVIPTDSGVRASAEDIARETAESFNRRRELQAQEEKECRGMSRARFDEVEAMKAEWLRKREEEDRRSGPGMELMKQGHIMFKTYVGFILLVLVDNS